MRVLAACEYSGRVREACADTAEVWQALETVGIKVEEEFK